MEKMPEPSSEKFRAYHLKLLDQLEHATQGERHRARYELGLQQREDALHRLVDVWATGEASASLGFAAARLFDELAVLHQVGEREVRQARLPRAEHVAGAAKLEVALGDPEAIVPEPEVDDIGIIYFTGGTTGYGNRSHLPITTADKLKRLDA